MSNQQNNNTPLADDVQGSQQPPKQRSRNFYRKRPGNDRQNQDLGEDENQAPNDDDVQQSNNPDENNTQSRGGRGGFRRGRGRFSRGVPFYGNFHQAYSPYSNYMNGRGGPYSAPGGYYSSYNQDDGLLDQGFNNYPARGSRGGRGRGGQRGRVTKNESADNNENSQQQTEDNKQNKRPNSNRRPRRQRRGTNDNGSGAEQKTDDAVTDDQQQGETNQGSARQKQRRSNRRRRGNTNTSQNGAETEEQVQKPKDDETIVKNLVRNLVSKVARRLAPRNRQRSRVNTKEAGVAEINTDIEQAQPRNARRGGRGARAGNGYFIEQGYYDPYGMTPYYYGMYYDYGGRGFGNRRRGRGRGRFPQRGGANKENQPQENNGKEGKSEETNVTDGSKSQNKLPISEQVNQSSANGDTRQS